MKKNRFFVVLFVFGFLFSANLGAQDFGPNNSIVLQRNVVSFNLYGDEIADEIDHVELTWSKETENWVPKNRYQTYDWENSAVIDLHDYVQRYLGKGDRYRLVITFYYKDGEVGSLTLMGGSTVWYGDRAPGEFGEKELEWSFYYDGDSYTGRQHGGSGSIINYSNLLWDYYSGGRIKIPYIIVINSIDFPFWVNEEDRNKKNVMTMGDYFSQEQQVKIELDGSFFP